MQRLQRKSVVIYTNGQTCWLEHKDDPQGIWVPSHDVEKSDQALRGQINYVLYKRPEGWKDIAEPVVNSSLGEPFEEPFMLPVDKSYVKDMEQTWVRNKISELEAEIERWKQEWRRTENARGDFESGLAQCTQQLTASDNVNTQLRANLKAADDENTHLKQTCMSLRESIEKKDRLVPQERYNELEDKYVQAIELIRRVASGESYYPMLEKDIYNFLKGTLPGRSIPDPNVAMRLLNEIAMGRSTWKYESFNAWFSKVDAFLANKTIITEEMLRGELNSLKEPLTQAYSMLSEMKVWIDQMSALKERIGGRASETPLAQRVRKFFQDFPTNPVKL